MCEMTFKTSIVPVTTSVFQIMSQVTKLCGHKTDTHIIELQSSVHTHEVLHSDTVDTSENRVNSSTDTEAVTDITSIPALSQINMTPDSIRKCQQADKDLKCHYSVFRNWNITPFTTSI